MLVRRDEELLILIEEEDRLLDADDDFKLLIDDDLRVLDDAGRALDALKITQLHACVTCVGLLPGTGVSVRGLSLSVLGKTIRALRRRNIQGVEELTERLGILEFIGDDLLVCSPTSRQACSDFACADGHSRG